MAVMSVQYEAILWREWEEKKGVAEDGGEDDDDDEHEDGGGGGPLLWRVKPRCLGCSFVF